MSSRVFLDCEKLCNIGSFRNNSSIISDCDVIEVSKSTGAKRNNQDGSGRPILCTNCDSNECWGGVEC